MENLMLFFIILAVSSTFIALCSLVLPQYTAFFMKKPTTGKALYFWFAMSLAASCVVAYLRTKV